MCKIDVAATAEEDGKSTRTLLTKEISNLLHQTQQLYQVLDLTIQKQQSLAQYQQQQQQQKDTLAMDAPLAREEVAKLLLLIARAHGIGQLSDEQKRHLKMEVCQRKSHLRNILRQQDITQIMTALALAGSGN